MKMKKHIAAFMAATVLLTMTPAALAAGRSCSITVPDTGAAAGDTVELTVSVADNPGYTNYSIALDYDREKLELLGIEVSAPDTALSSCSTQWTPAEAGGLDTGKTYGYVTVASSEQITANGSLFTARFKVLDEAEGEAQVTPVASYVRDNTALFSVFEEIDAQASAAVISIESSTVAPVMPGDINGDGDITIIDAVQMYAAYNNQFELTELQRQAADVNGDGKITIADPVLVYAYFNQQISEFPAQ